MKAKKILMPLIAVIVIVAVMAVAFFTIGEEGAFATPWALLAPVIAIALALITKEVYSSLFHRCRYRCYPQCKFQLYGLG